MNSIFDEQKLQEKIAKMSDSGADKLHVLADFDKTLSEVSYINNKPVTSIIGLIRAGGHLSPEYASAAYILFEKYAP